jgi:hypothetical protein
MSHDDHVCSTYGDLGSPGSHKPSTLHKPNARQIHMHCEGVAKRKTAIVIAIYMPFVLRCLRGASHSCIDVTPQKPRTFTIMLRQSAASHNLVDRPPRYSFPSNCTQTTKGSMRHPQPCVKPLSMVHGREIAHHISLN